MVLQKRRRREGTDTEPASVKALRLEVEELKIAKVEAGDPPALVKALSDEVERLKLRDPKLEAECKTPQGEEKEVKLPTRAWAIIAGKLDENDVCSFALVSKQLREAQVLAGRELVTRPWWKRTKKSRSSTVSYFTEDWCAYWSKKFNVHHTDPKLIKRFSTLRLATATSKCLRSTGAKGHRKSSVSCGTRGLVIGLLMAATLRC